MTGELFPDSGRGDRVVVADLAVLDLPLRQLVRELARLHERGVVLVVAGEPVDLAVCAMVWRASLERRVVVPRGPLPLLGPGDRLELVRLRGEGWSLRRLAVEFDVSLATVQRALAAG